MIPSSDSGAIVVLDAGAADGGCDAGDASGDAASSACGDARRAVPAPAASGCISDVAAGKHELSCDGLGYDLSVPASCLQTQCGLIIDVHGGTMSARMEDKNTNLAALGARHGYVVIQPSAFAGLFSASSDDAKILAFAKLAIDVFHLDTRRVHMTGFSQGGYMTWRFVCQQPDFLASAAPAAAAGMAKISAEVDCSFTGSERPRSEIPLLYMHGTEDGLVDFENAEQKRAAVIEAFELDQGRLIAGDASYRRMRYENQRGTVFEMIDHDYVSGSVFPAAPPLGVALAGHCYPGSDDFTPSEPGQLMSFGCVKPTAFHWGETVMQFFLDHPRR